MNIFSTSSDYTVTLLEPVSVQDADGNISTVEFSKDPEITVSITDGKISKFHYQDSGYRILGADKNVRYAASNSMILVQSAASAEKTSNTISVSIKEIEGFDAISLYKNVLEKKIIDGIKTGEIALNPAPTATNTVDPTQAASAATPTVPAVTVAPAAPQAPITTATADAPATTSVATPNTATNTNATTTTTPTVASVSTTPTPASVPSTPAASSTTSTTATTAPLPTPAPATIAD